MVILDGAHLMCVLGVKGDILVPEVYTDRVYNQYMYLIRGVIGADNSMLPTNLRALVGSERANKLQGSSLRSRVILAPVK